MKLNTIAKVLLLSAFIWEIVLIIQLTFLLCINVLYWIYYQNQTESALTSIFSEPELYLPWLLGSQELVPISHYISFLGLAFGFNIGSVAWFKLSDEYKENSYKSIELQLQHLKDEHWCKDVLKKEVDKTLNSLIFERKVFVICISLLAVIAAIIVLFEAIYPTMTVTRMTMDTLLIVMATLAPVSLLLSKYSLKTHANELNELINWYKGTYTQN